MPGPNYWNHDCDTTFKAQQLEPSPRQEIGEVFVPEGDHRLPSVGASGDAVTRVHKHGGAACSAAHALHVPATRVAQQCQQRIILPLRVFRHTSVSDLTSTLTPHTCQRISDEGGTCSTY